MFWDHLLFPGWIHKKVEWTTMALGSTWLVPHTREVWSLESGELLAVGSGLFWNILLWLLLDQVSSYKILILFALLGILCWFPILGPIPKNFAVAACCWTRSMSLIFCLLIDQFSLLLAAFPCFVVNKVIHCQPRRRGGCQGLWLRALDWRGVSVEGCQGGTSAWGSGSGELKKQKDNKQNDHGAKSNLS